MEVILNSWVRLRRLVIAEDYQKHIQWNNSDAGDPDSLDPNDLKYELDNWEWGGVYERQWHRSRDYLGDVDLTAGSFIELEAIQSEGDSNTKATISMNRCFDNGQEITSEAKPVEQEMSKQKGSLDWRTEGASSLVKEELLSER